MSDQWYYTHTDAVHGPVSGAELCRLVEAGGLLPADLIWPDGFDQTAAVPAEAAFLFPVPTRTEPGVVEGLPTPMPNWLPQLAKALVAIEERRSLSIPSAESWLPDVRLVEEKRGKAEG